MTDPKKHNQSSPLLLLGWDGAEWSVIRNLIDQGEMPHFQNLLARGSEGALASLQPMISPLLWTSVASGKRAHEHGVLGFVEESLQGPRAISSLQRRVPALWNILSEAGISCQVLNWWPSNPVEAIRGDMISNLAFAEGDLKGQFYPKEWGDFLISEKEKAHELDPEILAGFFPEMAAEQLLKDPLVQKVGRILLRSRMQFNCAMAMLQKDAQCRMFYFEALDQLQHLGAAYFPPQQSQVSDLDFKHYQYIISAAYRWHDAMLGSMLNVAAGHNVILISDHGFELSAGRQKELPNLPAAPASEHKAFGVFAATGPDFVRGRKLYGISLLDLVPTILHHFQLPLAKDMEGRIIKDLLRTKSAASWLPTWDVIKSSHFLDVHAQQGQNDALRDLEELQYLDLAHSQQMGIREEHNYNKAISLREVGAYAEALQLCDQHWLNSEQAYRWYILKARLILNIGDAKLWDNFWQGLKLEFQEDLQLRFCKALSLLQKGRAEMALIEMQSLEKVGLQSPTLYQEMGHALFLASQWDAADQQFDRALALNKEYSPALNGKAQVAFAKGAYDDFEMYANQALSLKMHQPHLHYLWALHYHQKGEADSCRKALQLCLQMAPKHQKALILREDLIGQNPEASSIIISGFPRSGTSFMMALLEASGLEILQDHIREADHHNPKGYYEWEALKNLPQSGELPQTEAKVLKVVAPLLPYLPADRKYKVIWMDRPLLEIILSQAKMRGEPASLENFPFQKGQQLERERQRFQLWLDQQPYIEWMEVSYRALLKGEALPEISRFLGHSVTKEQWEKTVDPQLHRNKIG
ncbi:alkaline phosphatase family protein [Croceimicrobium sp.]|uniref:alkaline phosphatase family protein n=1 Tax=Croceimicrobium sp. TaxID=2828340 RepID=UPI003BAA7B9A